MRKTNYCGAVDGYLLLYAEAFSASSTFQSIHHNHRCG